MLIEADFCDLKIPGNWLRCGRSRFASSMDANAFIGEIEEAWLEGDPISSSEYFEERKALLGRSYEGFEVLSEGSVEAGNSMAESLVVRFEDDNLQFILQREIILTEGPVLCILRISGPEDSSECHSVVLEPIVRSFHLNQRHSLATSEKFSLFSEPEHSLVDEDPFPDQRFPVICHRLTPPQDWSSCIEGSDVVLKGTWGEVRIRRLLAAEREANRWIVARLAQIREGGGRLLGWSQGSTPHGAFCALWSEAGSSTWRTAATHRQLVLRLATSEPLEFTVRAQIRDPTMVESVLWPLISSLCPLASNDWQTHPLEPWVTLCLDGPWTSTEPGLYTHPELFIPVLELRRQDGGPTLDALKPSLHESLRQGASVLPGSSSESAETGVFQGREAWRYRADAQLSIRGLWIVDNTTLYSCLLQTRSPGLADKLFLKILNGLKIPAATEEKP